MWLCQFSRCSARQILFIFASTQAVARTARTIAGFPHMSPAPHPSGNLLAHMGLGIEESFSQFVIATACSGVPLIQCSSVQASVDIGS